MAKSKILEGLNEEQRKAVECIEGPSLIIAGPGSGKTRALTHKITHLLYDHKISPHNILAVTFTNKAAKEMKERVRTLLREYIDIKNEKENVIPSFIGTFHSISARLLRLEADKIGLERNFVIYDSDDSKKVIKDIIVDLNFSIKELKPKNVLGTISRLKGDLISPKEFYSEGKGFYFQQVGRIYPIYEERLKACNALDFSDLLVKVVLMLESNEELLSKYQEKFKYVLVDEYQDTNAVQYKIIKLLSGKYRNLTVVGDVSQSIYSWRGADYRNMLQFKDDFEDAKIFKLGRNYRSTRTIVNAAKSLIENNASHMELDLYTENGEGSKIMLFESENEKNEANFIIDSVLSLFDGSDFDESLYDKVAVLYRTNAQSRAIEEAFISRGIPYRIVGGVKFYDRKEIKDVLAYLKVFYNPNDAVSWARCINTPSRGIGAKTFEKIRNSDFDVDLIEELSKIEWKKYIELERLGKSTPLQMLDYVLKDFGYLEYLNDGTEESLSRIENLKELRTVAKQFNTLTEFLENIALVESSNRADIDQSGQVTLMTLHAAKGLEFDTVFLVGMEDGVFPHSRSLADFEQLEEERRLCYVGITRAKKNLYLTYTRQRTFFGQTNSSIISRFISELPENCITFRFG